MFMRKKNYNNNIIITKIWAVIYNLPLDSAEWLGLEWLSMLILLITVQKKKKNQTITLFSYVL